MKKLNKIINKIKKQPNKLQGILFDIEKQKGKIKPLHGVNNSPVVLNEKIPSFTDAIMPSGSALPLSIYVALIRGIGL